MKEKLIKLLNTFGLPVYLQGTMSEDEDYPSSFFTFYNFEKKEGGFYSGRPTTINWGFWVFIYADDPEVVETKLDEAAALLRKNGWVIENKGEDVASDEPSHTGRMMTCRFLEYMEVEG